MKVFLSYFLSYPIKIEKIVVPGVIWGAESESVCKKLKIAILKGTLFIFTRITKLCLWDKDNLSTYPIDKGCLYQISSNPVKNAFKDGVKIVDT